MGDVAAMGEVTVHPSSAAGNEGQTAVGAELVACFGTINELEVNNFLVEPSF